MASLYVLGNPDHYTCHRFVPFYWRPFVKEVLSFWVDKLRPEEASDNESVQKNDRSFLPGHPQSRTHQAHLKKEDPFIVPNFLPNTLPRVDRGDREYYCCTMLTLFKPWRSGKDLKAKKETWDKSFMAHDFGKRQITSP